MARAGSTLRRRRGAALRALVLLVVIVAVAAVPLLVVYRSECPDDGAPRARWSFVPPFTDPPEDCRDHRSGLHVVLDEIGL